jgi:hypothetical protein
VVTVAAVEVPEVVTRTVTRAADWLTVASPWRVLGATAAIRALTTGIWVVPSVEQWLVFARDPFGAIELHPDFRYITGSPFGPLLAHATGADTKLTYGLLHLALLALSAAVLVLLGRRTVGDRCTNVVLVALFASPLSAVLLTWLGQPDGVMFGGMSAVALASAIDQRWRRLAVAAAGAAVVGLAAPEQGLVAVAVLGALAWWGNRPGDREVLVVAAGMLVLGRLGIEAFLAASDAPHVSRLDYVRSNGVGYFLRSFFENWAAVVFSLFGAGWLLAVSAHSRLRRTWGGPWPVRLALLLVFVAVATTYDQTRVATLVSWPAYVWLLRRADERALADGGTGTDPRLVAATFLAGIVIPPVVIWEGEPLIAAWGTIFG